jgi:hypothetical protein
MLYEKQHIIMMLDKMKDDDTLTVIKHGDEFEAVDTDQPAQGRHVRKEQE